MAIAERLGISTKHVSTYIKAGRERKEARDEA
jgi:predicted transcriptional regulator